ncbi:MAG: GDSL-type esterase/lipase family protein [Sphingomonas adhaesiva]|uniref:GDSL-type esterase/lipase family protein n=1 Tax=Sphingomonas adhaesiva TaxID=28212 RepID=UPI002FF8F150
MIVAALLLAASAVQAVAPAGPCPPAAPDPAAAALAAALVEPGRDVRTLIPTAEQLAARRQAGIEAKLRDWPQLCRYAAANHQVAHSPEIVLLGDSLTDFWQLANPALFGERIVDRGISGQTTSQMLVRFYPDVVQLKPRAVQIVAGVNDIAGNTGPVEFETIQNNIRAMVALARANGLEVILGTSPHITAFWWQPAARPAADVARLNAWITGYARQEGLVLADYGAALAGPDRHVDPKLSNDGVHPNRLGYTRMQAVLERVIAKLPASRGSARKAP